MTADKDRHILPGVNAFSQMELPLSAVGSEEWRREMLALQARALIQREMRSQYLGELLFVLAGLGIIVLALHVGALLGFGPVISTDTLNRVGAIATLVATAATLALGIFLWRARLKLFRSEMRLLELRIDRLTMDEPSAAL